MISPTPRAANSSPAHSLLTRAGAAPSPLPEGGGPGVGSPLLSPSPPPPQCPSVALSGETSSPWCPRDSQLLSAFLESQSHPLPEVAARAEIFFADFLDWLDQPHVLARIERIERATTLRSRILAAESRALAIDALRAAAQAHLHIHKTDDPAKIARLAETSRKAAGTLLRMASASPSSLSEGGGRAGGARPEGATTSTSSSTPTPFSSSPSSTLAPSASSSSSTPPRGTGVPPVTTEPPLSTRITPGRSAGDSPRPARATNTPVAAHTHAADPLPDGRGSVEPESRRPPGSDSIPA